MIDFFSRNLFSFFTSWTLGAKATDQISQYFWIWQVYSSNRRPLLLPPLIFDSTRVEPVNTSLPLSSQTHQLTVIFHQPTKLNRQTRQVFLSWILPRLHRFFFFVRKNGIHTQCLPGWIPRLSITWVCLGGWLCLTSSFMSSSALPAEEAATGLRDISRVDDVSLCLVNAHKN